MPDQTVEPLAKTTPDLVREQIERLREIFPECVAERRVDFDLLCRLAG